MASAPLESNLADLFVKKAPKMPDGGKKFFVDIAPWGALIGGVLTLVSALSLWHWAHLANSAVNYARDLCNAYASYVPDSCAAVNHDRLTVWIWLSLLFLAV